MLVQHADAFQPGDTIVIIQMKGAVIDSSNTPNFGDIVNYRSAGNYEFNYILRKNGNQIIFKNKMLAGYNIPDGNVQLIRVPYYKTDVIINTPLTAANWDGFKGGVLVLNVAGNIRLNAAIDVSGKGFRGGIGMNRKTPVLTCGVNIYTGPASAAAAQKGESIVTLSENINYGRGAPASGGGGGQGENSGGGGGGNGGVGGYGGYQQYNCTNGIFDNRGVGGRPMDYSGTQRAFLGSGGGAGDSNNEPGMNPGGGNGGGIAIIIGNNLMTNANEINVSGADAPECVLNGPGSCHDGMGGGGAGGSILLNLSGYADQTTFDITGGKGADMRGTEAGQTGPGGGGGGGIVWFNDLFQPANAVVAQSGGPAGVNVNSANDPWGAMDGDPGRNLYSLVLPFSTISSTPNIESIGFNQTTQSCTQILFDGFAQTNITGITSWNWDFGDGTQQTGQQVSHNYATGGDFVVSLFVTDAFGCKDTTVKTVKPGSIDATAGTALTICANASFTLQGTGGTTYSWSPGSFLNDSTQAAPVGSIQQTTRFTVVARDGVCEDTASVLVTIQDPQQLIAPTNVSGCEGSALQLKGNNGNAVSYEWSPSALVSDPTVADPIATASGNTAFTVKITEPVCNTSQEFPVLLTVLPKPDVQAQKSNDVDCNHATANLMATGAEQYSWMPASNLNNSSIANPVATITATTLFTVTGTTTAGCTATDTVTVVRSAGGNSHFAMPNAFTPNNDGKNDCFGVQKSGDISLQEFSIYNRWGHRVFSTKNPSECWNGNYQGKLLETGGYAYVIKGKSDCGAVDFKGIVMLIR